jgi:polyhydroxyalkanoate synthesis regulator phasin
MAAIDIRFLDAPASSPRELLDGLVQLGLISAEEADRVALDIELVMLLVSHGTLTEDQADAVIQGMAQHIAAEKEPQWIELGPPAWALPERH